MKALHRFLKSVRLAIVLQEGDILGTFTVAGITAREIAGLKAVKDPGFAPVLAALGIVLPGLCLTFMQNWGEGT